MYIRLIAEFPEDVAAELKTFIWWWSGERGPIYIIYCTYTKNTIYLLLFFPTLIVIIIIINHFLFILLQTNTNSARVFAVIGTRGWRSRRRDDRIRRIAAESVVDLSPARGCNRGKKRILARVYAHTCAYWKCPSAAFQ